MIIIIEKMKTIIVMMVMVMVIAMAMAITPTTAADNHGGQCTLPHLPGVHLYTKKQSPGWKQWKVSE